MANAGPRLQSPFCQEDSDSEGSSNLDIQRYRTSYQNKAAGWAEVNKSLRHHGLPPVAVLPLSHLRRSTGKGVCLDETTSEQLCESLLSLMGDCDHRQRLVQDLITRNDRHKEELTKQTDLIEKYQNKVKDLKVMLESSRNRVMELEDERKVFGVDNDEGKGRREKSPADSRYKQLQQTCQKKEREIEKLRRKLRKLTDEEEKRSLRQNQVFQEFKKRTARAHNAMDEKLLDVIDSYEREMEELKEALDHQKDAHENSLVRNFEDELSLHRSDLSSNNHRGLVKTYEKQLREARKQIRNLEEQNEILKLELEGRPPMKDFRAAQQRVKKLEKLLSAHKIRVPGEKQPVDPYRLKRKYSSHVEDLEYLPLESCQLYLKEFCKEVGVNDIEDVMPAIQKLRDTDEDMSKFENFAQDVHDIVQSLAIMSGNRRKKRAHTRQREQLSDKTMDHDLVVLEQWREDERHLPDLQQAITCLANKVAPWLRLHLSEDLPVSKLVSAIDRLTEDEEMDTLRESEDGPSKKQLKNIVSHFQMLFEVPLLSGVYARMNDLYVKHGEVQNVLHTLRNILGLKEDAKCTAIVDSVGKLCQAHNSTTSDQLRRLLQTDDLDSVIKRLEEHTLFFPIFNEVMRKVLDILGLERMDQVIPAVRALKLLAA